ncbi:MAG: DNA methyltransferase [Spirochaetaceae bacterium]|nr:MAG: DNA methyltransferase [Spirochaetaceae bacterium]
MGLLQDTPDTGTLDHPYLRSQLIAYIGNKRRLLRFLFELFGRLDVDRPIRSAVDPFAGSGSVARLLRFLGCAVHANDWEHYAALISRAYITIDADRARRLFAGDGGIAGVVDALNQLDGEPVERYVSRWYAPRSTETADYRTERLFYTQENALFIDRVRGEIERRYPPIPGDRDREDQRALLIALLLYEAATHVNTSGVFKAYHKGFGGHSRDALGRILAPMQLEVPVLIDGTRPCSAGEEDALICCTHRPADLVYLDPPYNQHQYGSNYFMLNTIALWDRPPVDDGRRSDGSLRAKAGIRPDWTRTRSDFCSSRKAPEALAQLLDAIDADRIVLSYNERGAIPMEALLDLCSEQGAVTLESTGYASYRGGRQSLNRSDQSHEFALLIQRSRGLGHGAVSPRHALLVRSLETLCGRRVDPAHIAALPPFLRVDPLYRVEAIDGEAVQACSLEELQRHQATIQGLLCGNHGREAEVLLELLEGESLTGALRSRAWRELFQSLRKLAHRKYRTQFEEVCSRASDLAARYNDGPQASEGVTALGTVRELKALAARRAAG